MKSFKYSLPLRRATALALLFALSAGLLLSGYPTPSAAKEESIEISAEKISREVEKLD